MVPWTQKSLPLESAFGSVHPFLQGSPVCPTHADGHTDKQTTERVASVEISLLKMNKVKQKRMRCNGHAVVSEKLRRVPTSLLP